jgi:hypothetical protein
MATLIVAGDAAIAVRTFVGPVELSDDEPPHPTPAARSATHKLRTRQRNDL